MGHHTLCLRTTFWASQGKAADAMTIDTVKTHNGTLTIGNPATGEHRTFQVRTQPEDSDFAAGERVVALLSGPDNTADYRPFGFVTDAGIRVWRRHRGTVFDAYARMLNSPAAWIAKHQLSYQFATTCRRCNRQLTDPESIRTGIGPVCRGKE